MAYIYEFTIHGLAGRKTPVHKVLDRHTNVFWGLNGSGKTSLLKILHSALRNDTTILTRVPFERAEVIFRSSDHGATLRRTIIMDTPGRQEEFALDLDLGDLDIVESNKFWTRVSHPKSPRWETEVMLSETSEYSPRDLDVAEPFAHTYLPISRVSQSRSSDFAGGMLDSARKRAVSDALLDEMFAHQVRRKWQAYTAASLSLIRRIQQQGLASILAVLFGGAANEKRSARMAEDSEEAYALVQTFLRDQGISLKVGRRKFIERYENESDLQRVVSNIQEVTDEVDNALRPQREFQSVIEHFYSGDKRLIFSDTSPLHRAALRVEVGGKMIPLESLSSGEKQLLQLLLETLASDSSSVLIDEPELSMHVDWQLGLVASMQRLNPECQLILATHSPEVMADVPNQYVFQL
ncbi:AAA family ATPase [Paenarthrobacter nitroguajacolicus]|uniref:AAA family ATPase n=1 Tax=Paenarthrobacter nitroguajacolicus TaxID=211146 RepID=UPI000A4905A7|nr:AAA family ATPase [Paenarthrobacter nitroguajacolicus]